MKYIYTSLLVIIGLTLVHAQTRLQNRKAARVHPAAFQPDNEV